MEDRLAATLLAILRPLALQRRLAIMAWMGGYVLGPLAGMPARIRANLKLVWPDMPQAEVRRLCRRVPANMVRSLAETFSGAEFIEHVRANSTIFGDGVEILDAAARQGRPVVLVTAHFGNYDAARIILKDRGCQIAGVYMPMRNAAFNERYVAAMARIAAPVFPRNRPGVAGLVKYLRQGGMIGLVADHYMDRGTLIDFLGHPARTALSAAELALKYDALLVPVYGIRNEDGSSFSVRVDAPVPHSNALTMTRALNASLEQLIHQHPDQWMWSHRRWKHNTPRETESARDLPL